MKFKLLLALSALLVCGLSLKAQNTKGSDDNLIAQMTLALQSIGTSADQAAAALPDFYKDGERPTGSGANTYTLITYRSHLDTNVYIGFRIYANREVNGISILLPHSYFDIVTTFLAKLDLKPLLTSEIQGYTQMENDQNTVFWNPAVVEGKMMLLARKKKS